MNRKKIALGVGKGILIGYATLFVLATAFQRMIIYPSWTIDFEQATKRPFAKGLMQGTVTTNDGEMLKAYWKPPAPGMPVIITFHGNAATPQPYANRFGGKPWADRGYGVLAVAYRGYPGSTGEPSEHGLLEDGRAAYDFARKQAPHSQIVVHGHSLGSGVAVGISSERRVLAVILDAPFTSRYSRPSPCSTPSGRTRRSRTCTPRRSSSSTAWMMT
jgi:alpha-beta hydrolase superfamily lysophospholipase